MTVLGAGKGRIAYTKMLHVYLIIYTYIKYI